MSLTPEEMESLRQGMAYFRDGDYFAAHDAWEDVWQGLRDHRRTFLQAMIQLTVGAYHLKRGNHKGCTSQWSKALHKCNELAHVGEGDVPALLPHLTDLLYTCLACLQQGTEPWPAITHFADTAIAEAWVTLQQ